MMRKKIRHSKRPQVVSVDQWGEESEKLLSEFLALTCPLFQRENATELPIWISNRLYLSLQRTTESAVILASHGRIWDIEILFRSILEGTTKLAFILSDSEKAEERAHEFWYTLAEINGIRRYQRSKGYEEKDDFCDIGCPIEDELLSDFPDKELLKSLQKKYPYLERARIEKNWTFLYLIETLNQQDDPPTRALSTILGAYITSSNFSHQDSISLGLIRERSSRPPKEREQLNNAHIAGRLSDLLDLSFYRSWLLFRINGLDHDPLWQLYESKKEFFASLEEAQKIGEKVEKNEPLDPPIKVTPKKPRRYYRPSSKKIKQE